MYSLKTQAALTAVADWSARSAVVRQASVAVALPAFWVLSVLVFLVLPWSKVFKVAKIRWFRWPLILLIRSDALINLIMVPVTATIQIAITQNNPMSVVIRHSGMVSKYLRANNYFLVLTDTP